MLEIRCAHVVSQVLHVLLLFLEDLAALFSLAGQLLLVVDCVVLLEALQS
jgi:hypothetical protein